MKRFTGAVIALFALVPDAINGRGHQLFDLSEHHPHPHPHPNRCMDLNPWLKPERIDTNKQPVIGIVSQTFDFTPDEGDHRFDNYTSYIMGGYTYSARHALRPIPAAH